MSIYRDKATGRWRFDFDRWIGGTRVRRRKLLPAGWTRAQADDYDRKEGATLSRIAEGLEKPKYTIDDAVALYYRERTPALKAGANAKREIEQLRQWWEGRPLDALPAVCVKYTADQTGALKPATIKNRIAYLRSACRWAWKRHSLGETDPGARVVAPEVKNARTTTITRLEMVKLARACRHKGVRALIRIAFYTGMRVSEIQRARRVGGAFVLDDTKNGEPRIVPMLPVITSASRVKMPRRSEIDYYWPLARAACKLEHVRLHDIRHSTATEMVNAGVDLATVGAVLGHKSAASTKRYAHHGTQLMAGALSKVGKKSPTA